jgi:DMSO/TMAO reductase YedYZ molybdopterin-dependent catalytic subunit
MIATLLRHTLIAALGWGLMLQVAVQAHDLPPPASPATQVLVNGAVQQALSLSAADLRQFPPEQIIELRLPARDANAPPSVLKGVRLRAVLERAQIKTVDHNTVKKLAIVASASDGYKVVFSWNELFNADLGDMVLVVFERDGKPLAPAEGPFALISGKDLRTGPRHVKWLQTIEVRQIVD